MRCLLKIFTIAAIFSMSFLGFADGTPRVLIKTELGDITVDIFEKDVPITAANFLKYVDNKLFDGATFYRVVTMDNQPNNNVKIEVIQGGLGFGESEERFAPIEHETTVRTGIRHKDGVISMARNEPGSASSEIFICINDQPELDFGGRRNPDGQGFAAFGKVIEGMEVVRKIQQQPAEGQMLNPKINIYSITRIE
ncbi:MAG: peptidylprolyl isomerase [Candidatus Aminicenantaceae bacterium]